MLDSALIFGFFGVGGSDMSLSSLTTDDLARDFTELPFDLGFLIYDEMSISKSPTSDRLQ